SPTSPICFCPTPIGIPRPGLLISFYEPSNYIETVKDPFCFPSLGFALPNPWSGFLSGSSKETIDKEGVMRTFAQAHWFRFPVWHMLNLLIDWGCVEQTDYDLLHITEVDPLWNDDMLALIISPEALLYANAITQTACTADSTAVNTTGQPNDALSWCMGSWGSTYPMTGHMDSGDYIQANAGIAARLLYRMARLGNICDPAVWECACTPTPFWIKSHYKIHVAKPVRDITCRKIGTSGITWSDMKNPPYHGDNFMWMIFRERKCCAF
ncbi:MAG: conjugal transfer protein TraU, partial [Nitrospirae bacterium]